MGKDGSGKAAAILGWRGLLASARPLTRALFLAALAIATVSMAFAQLGLAGLGSAEAGRTYVVLLLAPVALGSLLFGAFRGAVFGFVAGTSLLVHSWVQPLDFFEVYFITPLSSCALFTVMGLVQSILFAAALHSDPPRGRRIVRIVAVCAVGAAIAVIAFRLTVLYELTHIDVFAAAPEVVARSFGALWAQFALDAVLVSAVCVIGDALARRFSRPSRRIGLRSTFRGWLLLVVLVAFMATAGVGFSVVTLQEEQAADELMRSETGYLSNQIQQHQERLDAFAGLLESGALEQEPGMDSYEQVERFRSELSVDQLLDGYSEDYDGLVLVIKDYTIVLSDSAEYPVGSSSENFMDRDGLDQMSGIADADQMVQVLDSNVDEIAPDSNQPVSMEVAYLRAAESGDYLIVMLQPASMVFADRAGVMVWLTLSALVLLLAVFVASTRVLGIIVGKPIDAINGVLANIAEGDLAARAQEESSREFASLSEGVNATVTALEDQIAATREGIRRELEAASAIQEAALPRVFPPFPNIERFDLYANMQPAKLVGGDFYDFFLVGEGCGPDRGKLGFLVADVSGKGVPAALFMMAAKTAIRSYVESGMELGEAFENVNRKLCDGNDASMFVTAFAGVLDYGTGKMTCVNAGHNAPLMLHEGSWRLLKQRSGLPLGMFDGMAYKAYELNCALGDELLLYTDGVTEAMDADERLYGLARLQALLEGATNVLPRELIERVRADVAAFSGDAEQADDITMLALAYGVAPEGGAMLEVPADVDELQRVFDFVHAELDRRLCPVRAQRQLDIALEELFVNVAHYAYPDRAEEDPGTVSISYVYRAEPPALTVEISDAGVAFDPLAKPDAPRPTSIDDLQIGGLGILMAKKSVDSLAYRREDGKNVITIVKSW